MIDATVCYHEDETDFLKSLIISEDAVFKQIIKGIVAMVYVQTFTLEVPLFFHTG